MHAREGMEIKEPSDTVSGDVSWYNLYGEQYGSSLKWIKLQLPCVCFIVHSRLILCSPMDSHPPGSCVRGDSPGKHTGVGCHALLLVIFPTQGSKPGLLSNFTSWVTGEAQLDIYLKKTIISKNACTPMCTVAQFAIAWTWKQLKCPSTEEGIKKMWYICTMEYYSAIKKNETML